MVYYNNKIIPNFRKSSHKLEYKYIDNVSTFVN